MRRRETSQEKRGILLWEKGVRIRGLLLFQRLAGSAANRRKRGRCEGNLPEGGGERGSSDGGSSQKQERISVSQELST